MPFENLAARSEIPVPAVPTWSSVLQRCIEVTTLFDGCHLDLRVTRAARLLGLPDKKALQRLLVVQRLPPFQLFRNWCYTVRLADQFAVEGALSSWALRQGADPASYYKLVRKTTGRSWSEVRINGPEWARTMALQVWAPHL